MRSRKIGNANGIVFVDDSRSHFFPDELSNDGFPGSASENCRAAAAKTPLSRLRFRVFGSGSPKDLRGMTGVSFGSRAGVRAVAEVVKTFGTSHCRPKLLTSSATPRLDVSAPLPASAPLRGPANKQFWPSELHIADAIVSRLWGPGTPPPLQRGNTRDSTMDRTTD